MVLYSPRCLPPASVAAVPTDNYQIQSSHFDYNSPLTVNSGTTYTGAVTSTPLSSREMSLVGHEILPFTQSNITPHDTGMPFATVPVAAPSAFASAKRVGPASQLPLDYSGFYNRAPYNNTFATSTHTHLPASYLSASHALDAMRTATEPQYHGAGSFAPAHPNIHSEATDPHLSPSYGHMSDSPPSSTAVSPIVDQFSPHDRPGHPGPYNSGYVPTHAYRPCGDSAHYSGAVSRRRIGGYQQNNYAADEWLNSSPSPSSEDVPATSPADASKKKPRKHCCTMCHKSFDRPSTLKKHLLVHTGEKAYVCDYCQRRFSVASNRNRHIPRCPILKEKQLEEGHALSQWNIIANEIRQKQQDQPTTTTTTEHETRFADLALANMPFARKKRTRRPPSPTLWVPESLRGFEIVDLKSYLREYNEGVKRDNAERKERVAREKEVRRTERAAEALRRAMMPQLKTTTTNKKTVMAYSSGSGNVSESSSSGTGTGSSPDPASGPTSPYVATFINHNQQLDANMASSSS